MQNSIIMNKQSFVSVMKYFEGEQDRKVEQLKIGVASARSLFTKANRKTSP
jgi:hypothetical protein